jgi:hypothetical protein
MRWGFVQDGASETEDLQIRQSPTVCGRRPDILQHSVGPDYEYYWANTLVPLITGELILMFMVQDERFHSRDPSVGWTTTFRLFTYDHTAGTWGPSATSVGGLGDFGFVGDNIDAGPFWIDFDVTQYPDTGELVAVVIGNAESSSVLDPVGSPVAFPLIGACFHSVDNGLTWNQRSKIFFYSPVKEWSAQTFPGLYTTCPNNLGYAKSVSIETTRSGRLVAFVTTDAAVFSLASDDRGRSWTAIGLANLTTLLQTADTPPEAGVAHGSSSMRRMRDGVIVAAHNAAGRVISSTYPASLSIWMTVDGITWTEAAPVNTEPGPPIETYPTFIDTAVVQRPDGYPAIYQVLHAYVISEEGPDSFTWFDEMVMHPFVVRDPAPGDDASGGSAAGPVGILPYGSIPIHFHLFRDAGREGADPPNLPSGDITSLNPPPIIDGFSALAVCTYRGQLVAATTMMREPGEETGSNGLVVYRMDYFQPIQERLEPNVDDLADSALIESTRWIAGYGRAWDAYDDPVNWGYTLVTSGGTGVINAPNADGGYFESDVTVQQRYWEDTTLPWPDLNHNAVIRCVVRPISGGLPFVAGLGMEMGLHVELFDGNNRVGAEVRIGVSGADLMFQLHDYFALADIGAPLTLIGAAGFYVEVLLATWRLDDATNPTNVTAYVRIFDPATDPDLLDGYTLIATGTLFESSGPGVERVVFGHMDTAATAKARWKSVAMWRHNKTTNEAFLDYAPLAQNPLTFVDSDGESIRYDAASILRGPDLGYQNWMRPAQGIAYPAQFFADGLHAEWRGEAAVEGVIAYSTQFLYGARYLFDKSTPQREWRSNNTFENIEIVLDAEVEGGAGALFNPRAIAVIGRNWPICSIQFSNDDFVTIPLGFSAGIPGLVTAYNRNTHLLAFTAGAGTTIGVGAYRVRVRTPRSNARGGQTFWPNRFRSQTGGQKFYIAITDTSTPHVYEIADNDKDTLYLKTDLVAAGITEINEFCIFSDRFAWDFSYLMPDGDQGYRYMRLLLALCIHGDEADSFFYRCGSIILGQPVPFPAGIEWGYRVALAPGAATTFAITGAGYSTRNSAMRREWAVDAPVLRPPNEPETVDAMDIDQAVASWRKVSDMTRRVEANGEPCALIMDATRYQGDASEDGEQLLADPYDLAVVRATGVGNINHEAYMCREIPALNGTGNTEGVPKEVNVVAQIVFTEQL